ncbi:uncharacterized protein LOC144879189 [Branchiostoma floridae x Branchiostoma japonicum]
MMDLTAPTTRFKLMLKTLGVSRDAPGYLKFWVGSLTWNLCIRVLALPFYWYNFVFVIPPKMDDIMSCGYLIWILLSLQPCFHLLNVYWWFTGVQSLKRYLTNRKRKVN